MFRAGILLTLTFGWQMLPQAARMAPSNSPGARAGCGCGCGPVCKCCCKGKPQNPARDSNQPHLCRCPVQSVPIVQTSTVKIAGHRVPCIQAQVCEFGMVRPATAPSNVWARSHGPPDNTLILQSTVLII